MFKKSVMIFGLASGIILNAAAGQAASTPQAAQTAAFEEMMSPSIDANSIQIQVKPGDNLTKIAKANGVTVDLIKKVNRLSTDKLKPGMKLKIPTYQFSIAVDKSQNLLFLKGNESVIKTYIVATGKDNSTPVGVFKITDKLVDPTWYKAGAVVSPGSPENELGTRWLGITAQGYGIHGTIAPETLGQQMTAGCVRMKNEDVEELYAIVPSGVEVTIVD